MYQPEDDFNLNSSRNKDSDIDKDKMDANLSPKNVAVRKKQLEGIFIKLIAIGLSIGAVLGVGTYYLLNKLGLTKKPYQIEQERLQQEKNNFKQIKNFPDIPRIHKG